MLSKNDYLLLSNRKFYYLEQSDIATQRDNVIADLLDEDFTIYYFSSAGKLTAHLGMTKFWKDEKPAMRIINNNSFKVNNIKSMSFINMMEKIIESPDEDAIDIKSFQYLRNLKLYEKELKIQDKIKELRKPYVCTSAYTAVYDYDYHSWLPCPNCGLIPLTWEYNNGSSTACGCGDNEYNHFSIHSESIMSYIKRHDGSALNYPHKGLMQNWNYWVKSGGILYDREKEVELGKW